MSNSGVAAATVVSSIPGAGWTNGDNSHALSSSMYPYSRAGRMSIYQQRRWIPLTTGWTRIGQGTTEFDARHSSSQSGQQIADDGEDPGIAVKALMAQLCQNFYQQGWATGTGGGVSIRVPVAATATTNNGNSPSTNTSWRVFVAPSGIQKEDMIADDIFEMDMDMNIVVPPATPNLRPSACTPLWFCVYRHRPSAQCVIHTHSMYAQLATLLDPTETSKSLRITHLEMLKGVGNHAYDDVLEIPIIDNRPSEDALADQLEQALQEFPKANAVLVRRHGVYAWGDSWEQAKTQCESFDYLFHTAVLMKTQLSMDPAQLPQHGTYRDEQVKNDDDIPPHVPAESAASLPARAGVRVKVEEGMDVDDYEEDDRKITEPLSKKAKATVKHDFERVKSETADVGPVATQSRPAGLLLPRDAKVLILDIKGCTTPVDFFEDVLYPFVMTDTKWAMDLEYPGYRDEMDIGEIKNELEEEMEEKGLKEEYDQDRNAYFERRSYGNADFVSHQMNWLTCRGSKGKVFQSIQGLVWRVALDNEKLRGKVFPDLLPMLHWMKQNDVVVYTFSFDVSEQAQKPFFQNSTSGNLGRLIKAHYDLDKVGSTKSKESFEKLVKAIKGQTNFATSDFVFVSAGEADLIAAQEAGLKTILSVRPGNDPVSENALQRFPQIESLLQLCGE
jgi:methylthioribulose-1-phosphate dehydratase/2,3-diketo-5-methylthio-1-phosphopentane phosphatase